MVTICNAIVASSPSCHAGELGSILSAYTDPGGAPQPLPMCEQCGSQDPLGRINNRNYTSDKCNQGEERRFNVASILVGSCSRSTQIT